MTETNEAKLPKEDKDPVKIERERMLVLILSNSARMAAEYRTLIKSTGGLLTTSMVYAYSKGINDTLKLLAQDKGEKNEKSV